MKKILLSTMLCAFSALLMPFSAKALTSNGTVTASDLIGKYCAVHQVGDDQNFYCYLSGRTSIVEAGENDNEIVIRSFMNYADIPFIVNSDGTLTLKSGSTTYVGVGPLAGYNIEIGKRNPKTIYSSYSAAYVANAQGYAVYASLWSLTKSDLTSLAPAKQNGGDFTYYDYKYDFNNGDNGIYIKALKGTTEVDVMAFTGFDLFFFEPTVMAHQVNSDGTTQDYPMNVVVGDDFISLGNLFNRGMTYMNSVDWNNLYGEAEVKYNYADIDLDNMTLTVQPQTLGGCMYGSTFSYGTRTAYSYNSYTGQFTNRGNATGYWDVDLDDQQLDHWNLCSKYSNGNYTPISGTLKASGHEHYYHNDNYWVTNDGKTVTALKLDATLDKPGLHSAYKVENEPSSVNANNLFVQASSITIYDILFDVTHKATNTIKKWGLEDSIGLYLNVETLPEANHADVDHYELYVMPGKINSINNVKTDKEHGLEGALLLGDEYNTDFGLPTVEAQSIDLNKPVAHNKLIPASVLKAKGWGTDPKKDVYTVYVKTVYSNGLPSTFHSMASTEGQAPTGVDDVLAGEIADITAGEGSITISGSEGNAMICTMAGVVVYQGGDATVAVAPGMYVVRAGKTAQRLIVK